jgi:DNA (cytosine-5)-methyltransferase 1
MPWWAEVNEDLSVIRLPGTDYDANLGDVTKVDWHEQEPVDMITAGFPCQPVSSAGGKRGDQDWRWLWPEVDRAIAAQEPNRVLIENVPNLVYFERGRLWNQILTDLDYRGYGVRYLTLGACLIGCAHHRHRLFMLATRGERGEELIPTPFCGVKGRWDVFPTPTTSQYGSNQGGSSNDGPIRDSLEQLALRRNLHRYDRAITTHAERHGPPPEMTEIGPRGWPRLSAAFSEWLMCLPPGHVSDKLPRTKALEVIGNAVCPPQLAEAWRRLTESEPGDDLGQNPEREASAN